MTDQVSQLSIEAASVYEELFVPALFGEWAERVADAADLQPGDRVLDVACGTGVLSRVVAQRITSPESVVGIDPDDGMLAVAARQSPEIDWRNGVAEALPFDDESFDVVVSQFGLMFFSDPIQALREVRRVLRARGRTVFAVWSSLEDTPAYAAFVELLEKLFGRTVADGLRAPFTMGDPAHAHSLFGDAGFDATRVATRQGVARFPSLAAWIDADARGWLQLDEAQHHELQLEAHRDLRSFALHDGSVEFSIAAHIIEAQRGEPDRGDS